MNPYKQVPQSTILTRWLGPAVAAFLVGLPIMGGLAGSDEVVAMTKGSGRVPTAIVGAKYEAYGPPYQAAFQHFEQVLNYATHIPEVCWDGNSVNDFQRLQCEDFWNRLVVGAGVAVTPFLLAGLLLLLAFDSARGFYRRAAKRIDEGKALFAGTVTQPPEARNDAFGRITTTCSNASKSSGNFSKK
jgi:hypothetical protein